MTQWSKLKISLYGAGYDSVARKDPPPPPPPGSFIPRF